jgi:hypothetical protein
VRNLLLDMQSGSSSSTSSTASIGTATSATASADSAAAALSTDLETILKDLRGSDSVSSHRHGPPPADAATASVTASSDSSTATSAADGSKPAHHSLRELLDAISAYNNQSGQTATKSSTTLASA